MSIPVIDLFSGPGGLGEGFAGLDDGKVFRIAVSAEMDPSAHSTLSLRSFYRLLKSSGQSMQVYYDYCNGHGVHPEKLDPPHPLWRQAVGEALNITLGTAEGNKELDEVLAKRIVPGSRSVLIGGPPCQAYSLVGRARNKGNKDYRAEDDHRHFLYQEYLRVIQNYRPAVFVMENVKGILSSKVGSRRIFHDILKDLVDPNHALKIDEAGPTYRIYSLTSALKFEKGMDVEKIDPHGFIVRAEEFGIPQARHRVILLGIREDIERTPCRLVPSKKQFKVKDAIEKLPRLRSTLTKQKDSKEVWAKVVRKHFGSLASEAAKKGMETLADTLGRYTDTISEQLSSGGDRVKLRKKPIDNEFTKTLSDQKLQVVLNHDCRGHMSDDLRRYAYAAAFAKAHGRSPKGHEEFCLKGLAPKHANWKSGKFADRFRVQLGDKPATTVTSHISKDGHYFIHPDPSQCRSLTVREAARLQTFPDNYFFQGYRTEQFHQVGNAVPPLLAARIAKVVAKLLKPS
jgi:DNA (cytosine-5)-methyltransferase 1